MMTGPMPLLALLAAFVLAAPSSSTSVVELPPDRETAMALSAAPAALRDGAGVYRLGAAGYERVRPSTNGFNCLVGRDPNQGLAPVCYDREGSDTVMAAQLLRGTLLRRGIDEAKIAADIKARFADGRLIAPRRAGVAYMLSHDFSEYDAKLGRRACVYPPHIMIYAPYRKNADIGGVRGSMTTAWILHEGEADAFIIVPMTHDMGASCN